MGCVMDTPEGGVVHGEARRTSFVLFTDYGRESLELEWSQFEEVEAMLRQLRDYAQRHGHLPDATA